MDNLLNFEKFYEKYKQYNYYADYNQKMNRVGIVLEIIIMLFLLSIFFVFKNPTVILIFLILFLLASLIFTYGYSISVINNLSLRSVLFMKFKNSWAVFKTIKHSIKNKQLKTFSGLLDELSITEHNQLMFLYQTVDNKILLAKLKRKNIFDILATITTIISIMTTVAKIDGTTKITMGIVMLIIYYFVKYLGDMIRTLFNKNRIDIYEDIKYDLELKIMNYNKKLT